MSAAPPRQGQQALATTLRRLLAQALTAAECRLELVGIDLEDERDRIGSRLLRILIAVLLSFLSLQLLLVLMFALAWATSWWLPVVAGATVASLLASALAIRAALLPPGTPMFDSSVREFANDSRVNEEPQQ